jgi:hypothetical protein
MPRKSAIPVPIQIAIVQQYQAGRSARDVADEYGVHHDTVISLNRRIGAPVRRVGRPRKDERSSLGPTMSSQEV